MNRGRRAVAREGGFTLIEIILVIAILGFGLLGLSAAQLQAMKGGSKGRHATQAAAIAEAQMEQLQRIRWTSLTVAGWTAPVTVSNTVQGETANASEQSYSRSHQVADVDTGWTRSIDVRVTWSEQNGQGRSITLSSIRFNREAL